MWTKYGRRLFSTKKELQQQMLKADVRSQMQVVEQPSSAE
jgi:hypothetical protein